MTDVFIAATGACTAVGLYAESAAAAVRAGISRVREHPVLVDGSGDPLRCASVPIDEAQRTAAGRLTALGSVALAEVAKKALSQCSLRTVPLLLALPEPRPGIDSMTVDAVVRSLSGLALPGSCRLEVQPLGTGHAGALRGVEVAIDVIRQRRAEIVVVAGVDGYLDANSLDWLDEAGRLARDGVRGGIAPGEGAGALVLASRSGLAELGVPAMAEVVGAATAVERRTPDDVEGVLGEGLTEAVLRAASPLRSQSTRVDDVFSDINGERHRVDEWGFVALRAPEAFRDSSAYVSAVGYWGDVGAASGALGCVLAIQAWRRSYANGPRAMVCGSSWHGLRGAVVLQALS